MVRISLATRWEANQPAVSRARTTLDFGLGLGTGADKRRIGSPSVSARPPEEFLP
jgi:hypothetical protein